MKLGLTFVIILLSTLLNAQDFTRRIPRVRVGSVHKVQGSLVGLGRSDRSLLYLERGDHIFDKQTLITRNGSQAILRLGHRSEIVIGENTKLQLHYLQGKNRYLLKVQKGIVRGTYSGAGTPEVFITGNNLDTRYSAYQFDAVSRNGRFYFKPLNKSKVYKYSHRSQRIKNANVKISRREIELLSQANPNDKPVYYIKGEKPLPPKEEIIEEKESNNVNVSSSVSEAAAIFGDSITETSTIDDSSSIFGDSTENKEEAADIFNSPQEKKSQSIGPLSDNMGVRLQQKHKDLPSFKKLEKAAKLEESKNPLDMSLFLKSTIYASSPREDVGDVDSQAFHQDIRFSFGNKYQFNDFETLTFSGWVDLSNRREVYNDIGDIFDLQSSKRNYLYLNELYYTYTNREFDVQFGKKVLKTGKGIIYSPSDTFSPADATVPTSPLFLGNFFVSVDYYFSDWTFSTIILPAIVPNKSPTQNSRWTTLFSDIDYDLKQNLPSGLSTKSTPILLKLEGTKWGTDWLFTFFNGPNTNPVVRNDIQVTNNIPSFTLIQEHIPITFMSAGFSTTFDGLEVHGEILNQNAEDGKDDSFTALMLGMRYVMDTWPKKMGLNSIDFVLEHGRENLKSAQSQPFYALSSINSRFYQNSWVGTTVFNINDDLSFNYDFHFDLKNNGAAQILGLNFKTSTSQYRFKAELYSGDEESNFGKWDNNDNMSFEYVVNF